MRPIVIKSLITTNILVAYNSKFDAGMLFKEGIKSKKVICTLKLARTWTLKEKFRDTAFNV